MRTKYLHRSCLTALILLSCVLAQNLFAAGGVVLTGVGPVNRSMGGASTAAPIDAAGALHWNPASISGLASSEITFGMELLLPTEEISSTVGAFSGTDRGEPGVTPIPTVGWVHKTPGSRWTLGLGMYGIAGFKVNYPGSSPAGTNNPILFPQVGFGGLGRIYSEAEFVQIAPTISYAITENLSIGIAPTMTLARIALDPLFTAPPVAGVGFTSGRGTRWHFGGGVQAGIYYINDNGLHLGASIKSPQWFEDFRFFTEGAGGATRVSKLDVDYPMIVSLGAAYSGRKNWIFATDVRYINYDATDGFGDAAVFINGALDGLDWSSIFSVSTGAQYKVSECLYLRLGYTFQQNPIKNAESFFNVASPLIIEHVVSTGVSFLLTRNVSMTAAYIHGFQNSVTGPIPAGGTVTNTVSADALNVGLTLKY